jgi:phosphohistidine phosphatase
MGARFELVLFSPKVRAAQTAALSAEGWSDRARSLMAEHGPLASGFDARQSLEAAAGTGEHGRLLLIGHEPDLSRIVGEITGGRIDMKKGGVAAVRLEGGGGELVAVLRPRELALIAGVPVRGH